MMMLIDAPPPHIGDENGGGATSNRRGQTTAWNVRKRQLPVEVHETKRRSPGVKARHIS
jgi:hypothetical protein